MKILVELILGHRATVREGKTPEGYTHDWEVYVRSDQGNLQFFVDRVIFHLHESFPKPKRVVKEPPYILKESGYAGFNLVIEILFRNKEDPKNAKFPYDLFLQSIGPPINNSRKEKLIFNFPSEEFAKKLFKGGGILHDKHGSSTTVSDKVHSSLGNSSSSSQPSQPLISGGGKSTKHANISNPPATKLSPKNSFETLFGTPIKRSSGSIQLSQSTSSFASAAVPSTSSAKGSKSAKPEKIFGENPGRGGGKGEKLLSVKLEKSAKHPKSPAMQEPPESSKSDFKVSKSKSNKSKSSSEKKEKTQPKKMPPPSNTSVPKKAKKSDIFDNSPSNNNTPPPSIKLEKGKRRNSATSKSKSKAGNSSITNDDTKDKLDAMIKKVKTISKQPLSPITSSASSSSASSPSLNNSEQDEQEDEEEIDEDSDSELLDEKISNSRNSNIPMTPSPTPTSRKRMIKSESQSPLSNAPSPASSSSSIASAGPIGSSAQPPTKRRKTSSSSSVMTPETPPSFSKRASANNNNEISNSSNRANSKTSSDKKSKSSRSSKGKRSSPSHSKSSKRKSAHESKEKNRSLSPIDSSTAVKGKHSKKSKKKKRKSKKPEKMFDDSNSEVLSDSSSNTAPSEVGSGADSPSPLPSGFGTNGNGESTNNTHTFSHSAVAGNITAEMKLLKDLHARIATIEDPNKLQEIVEIVEGCGREMWNVDSGVSFDFDLCKLNSSAIKRLQQTILL